MNASALSHSQDDEVLQMVELRRLGHSCAQIGKKFGRSGTAVNSVTNKVLNADLEVDGDRVLRFYWAKNDKRNATNAAQALQ